MKPFQSYILLLILLASLGCSCNTSEKPNVIILVSDDQGYGDLSCHGNPYLQTPHLDQLYEESIRFTDFHTSSICTPTRAQLLTGIDAVRTGAYNFGFGKSIIFDSIPDDSGNKRRIFLMSEYFRENGYLTGHFGKWHLGDFYPYRSVDRGFDSTLTFPSASVWQSSNYWNNDGFDDYYYRNGKLERTRGYNNDLWFDETMDFILNAKQAGKPFFVYLPTGSMHTPLFVPEEYNLPYKDHPELVEQFFGMIANFDENYGRLDKFLEDNGVKENTILVYMSDNGGTFGVELYNAGMQGKKGRIWDGGHRVPCFIRWPEGLPAAGKDIDEMVVAQDILPTLIGLCRLSVPWDQEFDGLNIAPLISGDEQDMSRRMSVVQFSTMRRGLNEYGVLWNKWRLLQRNRLYNVENDPGQKHNVASQYPEIAMKMQAYYDDWLVSVQPSLQKQTEIDIGYPGFTGVELTCFDWLDLEGKGNPSQQYDIRQGMSMHGFWNINFNTGGKYLFTARRWPAEADAAISAGLPHYVSEYARQAGNTEIPPLNEHHNWSDLSTGGIYPVGKALAIKKAKLSINGESWFSDVDEDDRSILFEADIDPGNKKVQVDFLDEKGEVLCGAYYLSISNKEE